MAAEWSLSVRGVLEDATRTENLAVEAWGAGTATVRRVPLVTRLHARMASSQQDEHALLWDVFHFLSENLNDEMLSDAADSHRKTLLERLSYVFPELPSTYVVMNGKSHCDEGIVSDVGDNTRDPNDGSKLYCEKSPNNSDHLPEAVFPNASPENNLMSLNITYKEVCAKAIKSGPLLRRERLFFLGQLRRCWAGLIDNNLLVYANERDCKPVFTLDVKGFSAHRVTNILMKDQKKKDLCFEVVCPGQKTYQFIARTLKDVDQWVTAICEASGHEPVPDQQKPHQPLRKLPSVPSEDFQDNLNKIVVLHSSEEEIYHCIPDMQPVALLEGRDAQVTCKLPPELSSSEQREKSPNTEDDEEEAIYDDVNIVPALNAPAFPASLIKNLQQKNAAAPPIPHREVVSNKIEKCDNDLEIYDDVGPARTTHIQISPISRNTTFSQFDKSLHEQIMGSFMKKQKNPYPHKVETTSTFKRDSIEEFYESIDSPNP